MPALRLPERDGCQRSLLPAARENNRRKIFDRESAGIRRVWRNLYRLGHDAEPESGSKGIPAQRFCYQKLWDGITDGIFRGSYGAV